MTAPGPFQISQGLLVLPPKADKAYPIPCDEWDVLKGKCQAMSSEPWFFHSTGFLLLGVSASTGVAMFLGALAQTVISSAWAVVISSALSGLFAILFAHKERGVQKGRARDLVTQMELIERRYQ